ncbi:MAG TPA: hypothetical protein VM283_03085, partial [Armatimonadota bacterium]|nr:hypothetical protein [Armatimonadota bacterium]
MAHGAEYYVSATGDDAAAGSADRPWQTLHRALAAEPGLKPGDTVFVRGGEYEPTEALVIGHDCSGRADAPVTIAAMPGEQVTLRGSRTVGGWQLWRDGIWRADLAAQGLAG